MAPVLETCDREGIAAYLESSKESNIGFYRHRGFEVTGEVERARQLCAALAHVAGAAQADLMRGRRLRGGVSALRRRRESGGTAVSPSGSLEGSKTISVSRSSTARVGCRREAGRPLDDSDEPAGDLGDPH